MKVRESAREPATVAAQRDLVAASQEGLTMLSAKHEAPRAAMNAAKCKIKIQL